ncbi:MAG TPA: hypothetical protein VND96_05085 [Candidatus Micrarchaeaceae archaeon]|nr:hypothetical protein [Candidatus Micrarchaeaceae archaeon]
MSQLLDVAKQGDPAVFGDDLSQEVAEHADVAPELYGYFLSGNLSPSPRRGGGAVSNQ